MFDRILNLIKRRTEQPEAITISKIEIEKYPIYSCTAPFGILFKKTKSSGGGRNGEWSWYIDVNLAEKYIVKYMDGNKLKTIKLNAEDIDIVVDGTFIYEEKYKRYGEIINGEEQWEKHRYLRTQIIHLPNLPDPQFKMTDNFIKI